MRKFKLIKEYPGSPKLGTIIDLDTICWIGNDWLKAVKTSPEFWQEIVEKEYEILSIYSKTTGDILSDSNVNIWESNINVRTNWEIHSVKRLSDNEIFTIGDKLNKSYISKILLQQDIIWLMCQGNSINSKLNDAIKIKPLFTTEDGVDIFEGDKYFELALTFEPQFREAIYECIGRPNINYDYNTLKGKKKLNEAGRYYFSTKEAAEEYILMNKPCLSINDIINSKAILDTFGKLELKKLVQQKLNK